MLLSRIIVAAVTASALLIALASDVRAGSKEQCFDGYEAAQRARKKGHLREAQTELARCASTQCPAFITKDCTRWASEVEASLPTVVFVATDGAGGDLVDVRVEVDGELVQKRMGGAPVPLDPGPHRVRYTWNGKALDLSVVLAAGERNRRVEGAFPASPRKAAGAEASDEPAPTAPPRGGVPTATLVLGGVALAGGASFAIFALLGKSKESCAPHCARADVDVLRRDYLVADVSWAVGVAAAVAGGIVWWTQSSSSPSSPSPRAASLVIAPSVEGLSVGARGAF